MTGVVVVVVVVEVVAAAEEDAKRPCFGEMAGASFLRCKDPLVPPPGETPAAEGDVVVTDAVVVVGRVQVRTGRRQW